MEDYYVTLGVSKDANAEQIKHAYRKLARRWHPDANPDDPGAEARFKAIGQAYAVLSDTDKRAEYDRPKGASDFGGIFNDLGDIFTRRRRPRASAARDIETSVNLTFEQAVSGTKVRVNVQAPHACETCHGEGVRGSTAACGTCRGRGVIAGGICPTCGGRGTTGELCSTCGGSGSITESRSLNVAVPAGIGDGQRVRVRGKGANGGDLYVRATVQPHRFWRRDGQDLVVDIPVTPVEAVLQSIIEVPTLGGTKRIRIPATVRDGHRVRLSGEGPAGHDLLYQLRIRTPQASDEAREQLRAIEGSFESGEVWRRGLR